MASFASSPAIVVLQDHIDEVVRRAFHESFCVHISPKDGEILGDFHAKPNPASSFSGWLDETGYLKELVRPHR